VKRRPIRLIFLSFLFGTTFLTKKNCPSIVPCVLGAYEHQLAGGPLEEQASYLGHQVVIGWHVTALSPLIRVHFSFQANTCKGFAALEIVCAHECSLLKDLGPFRCFEDSSGYPVRLHLTIFLLPLPTAKRLLLFAVCQPPRIDSTRSNEQIIPALVSLAVCQRGHSWSQRFSKAGAYSA
jgi:hypothetical protein